VGLQILGRGRLKVFRKEICNVTRYVCLHPRSFGRAFTWLVIAITGAGSVQINCRLFAKGGVG
jgi:hypothetical protein